MMVVAVVLYWLVVEITDSLWALLVIPLGACVLLGVGWLVAFLLQKRVGPDREAEQPAASGGQRVRDERGAAAVWTLILATTAFTALVGLVGGGGELVNEKVEARRAAEQAARAGADELSSASVRSGGDTVNVGDAIARAKSTLRQAGWSGTVRVQGSTVVVTATGTRHPPLLNLLGVGSVRIEETGEADAISTPDG